MTDDIYIKDDFTLVEKFDKLHVTKNREIGTQSVSVSQ